MCELLLLLQKSSNRKQECASEYNAHITEKGRCGYAFSSSILIGQFCYIDVISSVWVKGGGQTIVKPLI